jgi:hypothetical protein
MKTDKRIDAYIRKSKDFARPILQYVRATVHKACPDIKESIKWGFPHFDYKGIVCSTAAFKEHCALTFWKGALLQNTGKQFQKESRTAMGHFGRITSLGDLPSEKHLIQLIKQAVKLNAEGIKVEKKTVARDSERKVDVPAYLGKALKQDKKTWANWQAFSYSKKKEYVEHIDGAKSPETREKRLLRDLEQIAENKALNWKYEKKK